MCKDADANVIRALEFEPQLRTWLTQCALDEVQIDDALNLISEKIWINATRRLSGKRLRRQTFELAQKYVESLWRQGLNGKSSERTLPPIPARVPRWRWIWTSRATSLGRARAPNANKLQIAELKRMALAIRIVSERCHSVFCAYKIERLSQHEVAERLSLTLDEVEQELIRASRVCADVLRNPSKAVGAIATARR